MKNILLKAAFLFCFVSLGAAKLLACEYGPPYRTVCQTFAAADMVIIGKIEDVGMEGIKQYVSIAVEKTFKGNPGKKIVLHQPLSSCDWDFSDEAGQTMLLYLGRDEKTGQFTAMAEGMGGRIERQSENLYWLDKLPQSLDRTRISGEIAVYNDEPFDFLRYVAGTKVRIFNEKSSFEVRTDKNGVYEIWDVPAGKYRIQADLPDNLRLRFNLERGLIDFDTLRKTNEALIEIEPKGCGGLDFVTNEKAVK